MLAPPLAISRYPLCYSHCAKSRGEQEQQQRLEAKAEPGEEAAPERDLLPAHCRVQMGF